jgi:polyhydroxyalkanoate synthase
LPILNFFNQIDPINIVNLYADKLKVGVTLKVEVYKEDKVVIYHFSPGGNSLNIPILIVCALVNRP